MTESIKYYAALLPLKALACLPLCVLYGLSDVIYLLVYYVGRYRRRITRSNIERVFPNLSVGEQRRLERAFYHHLCDLVVEIVKLLHISEAEMARRVEVSGMEHVNKALEENRPVFIMLGHLGNWEWVQQLERHMTVEAPVHNIYRPTRTKWSNRLITHIRSHFPGLYLPQAYTFRSVLRFAKEGKPFVVSFIADQHPNSVTMYHKTQFLGQETPFVAGPEELGQRIGATYIYINVRVRKRGYYHLDCRPVTPVADERPYPFTRAYMQMMEANILEQPEQWLWSHRRWLQGRKREGLSPLPLPVREGSN
ncbi:MAG: lysophospholipid acyltransferase family protein [Bacteroidaceae bacterium]|nr:lysophospholipid acyltransferase family protein [Bacteroidaceae bacterium]